MTEGQAVPQTRKGGTHYEEKAVGTNPCFGYGSESG